MRKAERTSSACGSIATAEKPISFTGDITFSHTSIMISVDIRCVPIGLQTTPI